MFRLRTVAASGIVAFFIIYILLSGIEDFIPPILDYFLTFPDFSKYQQFRSLSPNEFPTNDPARSVIIVGDIHGMIMPLRRLLHKVDYVPSRDVLVHVGDVAAKAPLQGSLDVLEFLSAHNATGVRGNHDQIVIEWRGWIIWIKSLPGGERWLKRLEEKWKYASGLDPNINQNTWLKKERSENQPRNRDWWKLVPKGWKLLGDHYQIASAMSDKEYHYLLNLPLRLYVPHVHSFIVHAGMLPADPRYPLEDEKRQPMARVPTGHSEGNIEKLRQIQEMNLLSQVPQNADPWVVLNMRSVLKGEVLNKPRKGMYWTKIWQSQIDRCAGFDRRGLPWNMDIEKRVELVSSPEATKQHKLPCYPISTIYGHTASKGLDINRWTFGLDSGCIYGRSLTALIIGGDNLDSQDMNDDKDQARSTSNMRVAIGRRSLNSPHSTFKFSDNLEARIVGVKC